MQLTGPHSSIDSYFLLALRIFIFCHFSGSSKASRLTAIWVPRFGFEIYPVGMGPSWAVTGSLSFVSTFLIPALIFHLRSQTDLSKLMFLGFCLLLFLSLCYLVVADLKSSGELDGGVGSSSYLSVEVIFIEHSSSSHLQRYRLVSLDQ